MAQSLKKKLPQDVKIAVVDGESQMGSGSSPLEIIPTKLLSISASSISPDELARRLRRQTPAVFTRIAKDSVLLDFRTIQPEEDNLVLKAIVQLW
jgi:L-seryl-tRNA(Ser) seleniumtransferase